jgi:hypothetical protein
MIHLGDVEDKGNLSAVPSELSLTLGDDTFGRCRR